MWTWRKQWLGYAAALCATGIATALSVFGVRYLSLADVVISYLVGVVVVAWRFGLGPSIIAGLGGVAAFDFLILPPSFTFSLEFGHAVTLVAMVFVSALVSGLTESLRREQARALRSERRTQQARLEAEVERVHAALLSSVSHDLRTPLATISASSQMLVRNHVTMDATLRGEVLAGIADEAERLDGLLRNLLAITRVETGELRLQVLPASLDEVLTDTLRRLEHRLVGRNVTLNAQRGLPLVDLDVRLFEQALLNVLDNALRYSPPGSPLTIETQQLDCRVQICISDSGVGVAPEDRQLVFEKFRRGSNAPRSDGGVGLGLTICRAVLRAHGGEITMDAAAGGGALVTLSLPTSKVAIAEASLRLPSIE
ncbi:MAG TPA: ATP-binding protein [Polyangiaceae bacterium]|nr:ATP-binding protein [Polyangiaceae bacterium]